MGYPPDMSIQALSELRHACLGCGGSCRGVNVRLVGDDEPARVAQLAEQLGVERPIEGGALRQVDGSCVFLDDELRCRIHARFGAEAKPRVCRQYPTVVVHTESGLRAGIDPGCYTAWRTWRDGPEIDVEAFVAGRAELDERQAGFERGLLALLDRPDATIAALVGALCPGAPDATGLPVGFAGRLVERLHTADVAGLIARPEAGPSLRASLQPLGAAVRGWSPAKPPTWRPLEGEAEAWALEVVRRTLYLRTSAHIPFVQGVALLTVAGAVACGWADPRMEAYGPALAGWSRALRAPAFWRALVPDPGALLWLATGTRPT